MRRNAIAFILISLASLQADSAETVSLEGQVVCSQCWFEADRSRVPYGTPGDLGCAKRCAEEGVPAALAVRAENGEGFELVELAPRSQGEPAWLDLVARFVRVSGDVTVTEDARKLDVASLQVLQRSPWPPSAPAEPAELSWTDLSGRPLDLEALHGRVVVVNFWATWCAPCRKEMPHLTRLQRRYGLLGVQVIGAAADAPDQRDAVGEFARRLKIEFPVVLGATTDQMRTLGLGVSLPATIVLDREGHAVERFDGVFRAAMLEDAVERALDLEPGEVAEPTGHVHAAAVAPAQASLVPS